MHPALEAIDLVVFDLDGTLIDSAPDLAAALDATLAEYGAPPAGTARVRTWVGNGTQTLVARALADATLRDVDVPAAHARFLEAYRAAPCAYTRVYDGARACLDSLAERGVIPMLVTNKPAGFLPAILDTLALDGYFALVLGGDSLAEKKPHPLPLLHAAQTAKTHAARSLIVGDSQTDIAAGRAAGFRTLAVTYGYNHGQPIADSHPDFTLDSLAGLADLGSAHKT